MLNQWQCSNRARCPGAGHSSWPQHEAGGLLPSLPGAAWAEGLMWMCSALDLSLFPGLGMPPEQGRGGRCPRSPPGLRSVSGAAHTDRGSLVSLWDTHTRGLQCEFMMEGSSCVSENAQQVEGVSAGWRQDRMVGRGICDHKHNLCLPCCTISPNPTKIRTESLCVPEPDHFLLLALGFKSFLAG